eukprot:gene14526-17154_t
MQSNTAPTATTTASSGVCTISEAGLFECTKDFRSKEKLPTYVYKYPEQASHHIASEIIATIEQATKENRKCVLGLSAGSTPTTVYDQLIALHKAGKVSFANVVTFNVDEYYPISRTCIQSYYRFMQENLFEHIDIAPENIHFLNGEQSSFTVEEHCEAYEADIKAAGGLDLLLLPIGKRIGFNEAHTDRASKTRLVDLEQNTRIDAASDFFGMEHVPHQALTMGLNTFHAARKVVLVAFSEGKASVVQKTTEGDVTGAIPSSYFQKHALCTLVIDEAAAIELTRFKCPWTIHGTNAPVQIKWTPLLARKAVIWLSLKLSKPILKLEEEEYHDNNLSSLLKAYGPCPNLNLKVFRYLQSTISGWPGGRPVQSPPKSPSGMGLGPLPIQVQNDNWDLPTTTTLPQSKRVIVFSPHPDDDVISMGGTFIKLCDQGHEVHVAYQTSGNIAVWDDDAKRFANFASEFCRIFGFDEAAKEKAAGLQNAVENFISTKGPAQPDSKEIQQIKGLIRQTEARAGARYAGVRPDRIHFLDLPFYETGAVKKKPLGQDDIKIVVDFLVAVKPEIIFAAGDLSDPHGTHRVCLKAILQAIEILKDQQWMRDCQVWLYRGAWQEWEPERIEMAVPMSPHELLRKRMSIFKHQSQKDTPAFPGTDKREFWVRAECRNRQTANIYDKLGLTEFEAVEAFIAFQASILHPYQNYLVLVSAAVRSPPGSIVATNVPATIVNIRHKYSVHTFSLPFTVGATVAALTFDDSGDNLYIVSSDTEVARLALDTLTVQAYANVSAGGASPFLGRAFYCNSSIYVVQKGSNNNANFITQFQATSLAFIDMLRATPQSQLNSGLMDCTNGYIYLFAAIRMTSTIYRVSMTNISNIELTSTTLPQNTQFNECSFFWRGVTSGFFAITSVFRHPYLVYFNATTLAPIAISPLTVGAQSSISCESRQPNSYIVATVMSLPELGITFTPSTSPANTTIIATTIYQVGSNNNIVSLASSNKPSYLNSTFLLSCSTSSSYTITLAPSCQIILIYGANSTFANTTLPTPQSRQLYSFQSPQYNLVNLVYNNTHKHFVSYVSTYTDASYIDVIRVYDADDDYITSSGNVSVVSVQLGLTQPLQTFQISEYVIYFFFATLENLEWSQVEQLSVMVVDFSDLSVSVYYAPLSIQPGGYEVIYHPYAHASKPTFYVFSYSNNINNITKFSVNPMNGFSFQSDSTIIGSPGDVFSVFSPIELDTSLYFLHYASRSAATSIAVFDTLTNKIIANVPVPCDGTGCDPMLSLSGPTYINGFYGSPSDTVFTFLLGPDPQQATSYFQVFQFDLKTNTIIANSTKFGYPFTYYTGSGGAFLDSFGQFGYFFLASGYALSINMTSLMPYDIYALNQDSLLPKVVFDKHKNNAYVLEPEGALVLNLDCVAGTYRADPHDFCVPCEAGTYSSYSAFECIACVPGTIAPINGSSACTPCAPGHFSLVGGTTCVPCSAYSYTPSLGSTVCLQCPNSTISNQDHTGCVCSDGFYGPPENCITCPAGAVCAKNTITPLINNWAAPGFPGIIYSCPMPNACLGGSDPESQCAEGYYGVECSGCVSGWSLYINSCSRCPSSVYVTYLTIFLCFAALFTLLLITYRAGVNVTFSALKILISYGQVISSISVSISTNQLMLEKVLTFVTLSNVDILHFLSLECLLQREVSFYESYWVSVATPILLILLTIAAHYLYQFLYRIFVLAKNTVGNRHTDPAYTPLLDSDSDRLPNLHGSIQVIDSMATSQLELSRLSDQEYAKLHVSLGSSFAPHLLALPEDDSETIDQQPMVLVDITPREPTVAPFKIQHPNVDALWRDILLILLLTYSAVCQTVLSLYSCVKVADKYYLEYDLNTLCQGVEWQTHAYLGSIFIFIYPIGVPLFFFVLLYLWKKKRWISADKTQQRLSLLYAGYNDQCWYWECVELVRKLLLTSAVSITIKGDTFGVFNKNSINVVVCLLALFLQHNVRPFTDSKDNWLQFNSLAMIYFIYFYLVVSADEPSNAMTIQQLGSVDSIVLLILAGVVVMHGVILAVLYGQKLLPQARSIIQLVRSKLCGHQDANHHSDSDCDDSMAATGGTSINDDQDILTNSTRQHIINRFNTDTFGPSYKETRVSPTANFTISSHRDNIDDDTDI